MKLAMPIHAFTGLQAVGLVNGRPVWPVKGGSDDHTDDSSSSDQSDEGDDGDSDGEDSTESDEEKPLGPAGEKALVAEKAKRRAEASKRRVAEAEIVRLNAELAKGTESSDTPDVETIQAEADKVATAKASQRILRSEIKAAAAGKLADPADAHKFLDLTQFEVDDDGNVDEDEIAEAITDLIQKKPYLAAQSGKRFNGSGDGGVRKGTKPDLHAELEAATKARDFARVIEIKRQLAFPPS